MKLSIDANELRNAVTACAAISPRKSPRPIMQSILLRTEGDTLRLAATDGEVWYAASVAAEIKEPGEAVINAAELVNACKHLCGTVGIKRDKDAATVMDGVYSFTMPSLLAADLPPEPKAEGEPVTLNADTLLAAIAACKHTMSGETSRYAINGALLVLGPKSEMVTTDGRALTIASLNTKAKAAKGIVPAKAVAMLERSTGDAVEVQLSGTLARFAWDGASLTTTIVEGNFPPYADIVPKADALGASVVLPEDAESVFAAVASMADEERPGVRVTLNGSVKVEARGGERKGEATIDAKSEGEGSQLLNPRLMRGMISGSTLRLGAKPEKPATLERPGVLRVVMPIVEARP